MNFFLSLIFVLSLEKSLSKSLPSYINKCSKSDPNLNKCLDEKAREAALKLRDGNRDLGVAKLEPFLIEKVDLGNRVSGSFQLHQIYNNMRIYGMSNSTIMNSDANFTGDNCYWNYEAFTPFVRMEADYEMKGQLLLFPINGHGKCTNHLYDNRGHYEATCVRYKKKNRTHLRVSEFKFNLRPGRLEVDYENIFDGNEQLSREIVKTLNENSESVYEEIGPAFDEVLGTVWKETLNQVFNRVPEEELFLP